MTYPRLSVGSKVLVTTDNWFYGPDGIQYRSVFGTVKGIFTAEETLSIKTNARSTNWYVQVGCMTLAGCQIHYVIATDDVAKGQIEDFNIIDGEVKKYTRPTPIFFADESFLGNENEAH